MSAAPANFWPTEEQRLLLRACLLNGAESLSAWERWKVLYEGGHLDQGSRRLLPLLYRNLKNQGCEGPLIEQLRQEYYRTWSQTLFSLHRVARVVVELDRAGIECLLLKGCALSLLFYEDAGLRPMADVDLLVRRERAELSIKVLTRLGWKPKRPWPEALIPFEQAAEFEDVSRQHLDLHWRLMWEGRQDLSDEEFWSGKVAAEVNGVSTYSLNPADHLLHVCVHGAKWNDTPSLRWVADAVMIINSSKFKVDWRRLVRQAQERRLTQPVGETLAYLEALLGVSIPSGVLKELRAAPLSRPERLFYRIRSGPNDALKMIPVMWHWANSLRLDCDGNAARRLMQFLRYLQSLWGVRHQWQLPFYLVTKPANRTYQALKSTLRGNLAERNPIEAGSVKEGRGSRPGA